MKHNHRKSSNLFALAFAEPPPEELASQYPHYSQIPPGYENVNKSSKYYSEAVAKAKELLANHEGEEAVVYQSPDGTEFLIKTDLHFDNHVTLKRLRDRGIDPNTIDPKLLKPEWHPGVSVYQKKDVRDSETTPIESIIKIKKYEGGAKSPEEKKREQEKIKEEESSLEKMINDLLAKFDVGTKEEKPVKDEKAKRQAVEGLKRVMNDKPKPSQPSASIKEPEKERSFIDDLKKEYEKAVSGVKSFFA